MKHVFKGVRRVPAGSVTSTGKPKQTTKPAQRTFAKAIGGGGKSQARQSKRSYR